MRNTIIALIFGIASLALAISVQAQNVPDSVFNYTYDMLIGSRDSVGIYKKIVVIDDKIINAQDSIIKRDSIINSNNETAIERLKNDMVPPIPPLIKWDGFYTNFIIGYQFNPNFVALPMIKVLKYAISGEFVFKIIDKLKITLEPVLPIGDKFGIYGKIGWRLF